MTRESVDRWCERTIVGLVLALMVVLPLFFGGRPQPAAGSVIDFLLGDPFLLVQWTAAAVLVLWLVRIWLDPRPKLLWPPVCWAVLAFVIYALVRYRMCDIEYVGRQEFIKVVAYAFLFFAVLNNLHRQETIHLVGYTLVFLACALSFYAIYQFLTGSNRVWHLNKPYPHRASGTYISPNHLGGLLEMTLPLGLAYTFMGRSKPLLKVLIGYSCLVIFVAIGATISRGAWISTAFALVLFVVFLASNRGYRLPLLALVVVVVGLGFFMFTKSQALQLRWRQVTAAGRVDDDMRFAIWAPAVKIWREHIWLGAGPDHFDWRFPAYRPDTVQRRPNRVHNDYLNTLADWGVVGAALVASVWIVLALMLWKTWRYVRRLPADLGARKGSGKFAFVWGASLGLTAILAHSFVDFNLHVPANAFIVVVLLALLSSHIRFATERFWVGGGLWAKVVATCLFLLPAAWLFEQSCSRSVESHWQARAARAPSFSTKQLTLLEKAFAAEPKNGLTARGIAECYRVQSAEGGANYRELGLKALEGFGLAMKLNPLDPESSARYGWCLDWLDRSGEAWPYFSRAEELDPNGYLTVAKVGLHFEEIGDFAAARSWFERSLRLQPANNPIATSHFRVAIEKLTAAAKQGAESGVTSTGR